HTQVRYVSAEQSVPLAVNVYANKVLLAVWGEEPLTIIIESQEINESFRSFFKMLWKTAKIK
ncbi:MAG: hypothetical protein WCW44_03455, partial [archaeon]